MALSGVLVGYFGCCFIVVDGLDGTVRDVDGSDCVDSVLNWRGLDWALRRLRTELPMDQRDREPRLSNSLESLNADIMSPSECSKRPALQQACIRTSSRGYTFRHEHLPCCTASSWECFDAQQLARTHRLHSWEKQTT